MNRLLFLLAALPAFAEKDSVTSSRIEFGFENGARANLAYHAICMTGRISCSAAAYRKLWEEKLAWSDADEALLAAFRDESRFESKPPKERVPFAPNYPAFYENESRQRGYFAAILRSGPKRGTAAWKLMEAMRPRFERWWREEGEARSRGYARDMAAMLLKHDLAAYSANVARLMGYQWRGVRRLRFHIIAHAEEEPKNSAGTQIGDQVVIEAKNGFGVPNMTAVTLHELFHYFYESMPLERHVALMRQFAAHSDKFAGAYYVFFNEALVSAAAAGADARMNPEKYREDSTNLGYGHPYIGKLAIALYPLIAERLTAGRNLLDGVVPEYIAAGRKELGVEADSLRFALGSRALDGEEAVIERAKGTMQKLSPAVGQFSNEGQLVRAFEHLNVVHFEVTPGAASKFERRDRTAKSLELRFIAPDVEALEKLIASVLER